jgi:kumamolisin
MKQFARCALARRKPPGPGIKYPRAAVGGYAPGQMPVAYGMPVGLAVVPRTVVILELGGAYYPGDTQTFCQAAGIPQATVNTYLLPGASNSSSDADGEVALDVQKAAEFWSYMTGLAANILIVWGPNSGGAFADIVNYATQNVPDLGSLSCSWGSAEDQWAATDRQSMDSACQACPAPVSSASGDNDSGDGESAPTTDYPAASPYVIGAGGTSFPMGGTEVVWNGGDGEGTGGGFSKLYPTPSWQPANSQGTGRMVPDLAMNGDPNTGHVIYINGQEQVIGGTSAVAPMWSGIAAAVNGARVKSGLPMLGSNMIPALWANPKSFLDITSGNNGQYNATVGPDPCSGLGRPLSTLIAVLTGTATTPPPPGGGGGGGGGTGPTLAAAQAAAVGAINGYAAHYPRFFQPYITNCEPGVKSALASLWTAPAMSARLSLPPLGPIWTYLEQILVTYGEAAFQQILKDILAGKVPVLPPT